MKPHNLKISRALILLLFFLLTFFTAVQLHASKVEISPSAASSLRPPPPTTVQSFSYTSPACTASGSAPIHTYTNYTPNGTFTSTPFLGGLQANGSINLAASSPGTYTITYYSSICNCVSINTIMIVASPPTPFISGPSTVCIGSSVTLQGSGAFNYSWNTGVNNSAIVVSPSANTVYTLTTTNGAGCSARATHAVAVVAKPVVTANSTTLCSGGSSTLTAASQSGNGISYTWYPGPVSGQTVVVSPPATQTYTLFANLAGCTTTITRVVQVTPAVTPTVDFSYPYPMCTNSGDPSPILAYNFSHGGTYFAMDSVNVNSVSGVVSLSGLPAGTYNVSYSLAPVGCTLGLTSNAIFIIYDVVNLKAVSEVTIAEGSSISLGVQNAMEYDWSPGLDLDCTDCEHPNAAPKQTIQYCVTDPSNGCATKACINVVVVCENRQSLLVPDAFTPDGDGRNDQFCLQGWDKCITDFKVLIYDRWGEKVFESTNNSFCWDGTFNGQKMAAGVYVYAISASINRAPVSVKKGNITLIR